MHKMYLYIHALQMIPQLKLDFYILQHKLARFFVNKVPQKNISLHAVAL